jgi:hypothetical protein
LATITPGCALGYGLSRFPPAAARPAQGSTRREPAGAVLAIWTDIAPELEADFDEWYWREHLPERLCVPGFRRGRRLRAIDGAPRSLACYDLASVETIASPAYLERLDNPTAGFRDTTRAIFRTAGGLGQACGATGADVAAVAAPRAARGLHRVSASHLLPRAPRPPRHRSHPALACRAGDRAVDPRSGAARRRGRGVPLGSDRRGHHLRGSGASPRRVRRRHFAFRALRCERADYCPLWPALQLRGRSVMARDFAIASPRPSPRSGEATARPR